jgi:hypothetical protein
MDQRTVTHHRWTDIPKICQTFVTKTNHRDRMMLAHVYLKGRIARALMRTNT